MADGILACPFTSSSALASLGSLGDSHSRILDLSLEHRQLCAATMAEQRVEELGLVLPAPPERKGLYRPALVQEGAGLVHLSGHPPLKPDGQFVKGKVGRELTLAQGKEAARQTGLAILATLRATLGSLDRVRRVVKSTGFVNCTPSFEHHPQVLDGYSELVRHRLCTVILSVALLRCIVVRALHSWLGCCCGNDVC
eukprot:m.105481 g.105481  ORF g.105481 m.105481 type:complete len:197 (+) comp15716_c0_seq4:82-672(+)